MGHFDSTYTDDSSIANNVAGDSENPNSETAATSIRPSAIERQIAATSPLGHNPQTYGPPTRNRRKKVDRRKTRRFGLGGFLILLWLVAVGLIVIFTDFGRMMEKKSDASPVAQKMPETQKTEINDTQLLASPSSSTQSSITQSSSTTQSTPNNSAQIAAPNKIAETSTSASPADAISIPVADISLRNNPALVEQLVQVYRSRLVADPHDATTQTALELLQERSLSDIQTLIAQGDIATADKSLEIFSRLFPELTDNVRYKYLLARIDYMRRQTKDESVIKPEPAAAVAKTEVLKTAAPRTAAVAPAASPPPVAGKKASESVSSSKPEIRSVSIMPGTMVEGHFVPSDGGNVFMVELSYSNFAKAFVEQNEATLVTLLGEPDDSLVLAEVPVTISADRGTKSFAIETNNVQGYAGGKFQLNFMLNDEFLTSRTLRLSRPR